MASEIMDVFAALAMQALIANHKAHANLLVVAKANDADPEDVIAFASYSMAESMMKEREKRND